MKTVVHSETFEAHEGDHVYLGTLWVGEDDDFVIGVRGPIDSPEVRARWYSKGSEWVGLPQDHRPSSVEFRKAAKRLLEELIPRAKRYLDEHGSESG